MFDEKETDNWPNNENLIKENRTLKRQLRNLESTFQRNKAMLAARTTINDMLESEQKKMEQNMNLLLENSADIILLFDKNRQFTHFTKTFLTATGLTNTSLICGKFFSDVFSPLLSKAWIEFIEENINLAMERRSTVAINSYVDLSGGNNPQEYDIQITPMIDQAAPQEAFMLLIHNITEIMRSKRQSENANMAKSQFLATMSHEMRTPMNAVLGMTAIGKMSDNKERMLYCFSKIEDASQHLLGVINDILDVSKIEAGKLDLSPAKFNFEKMLQRIVNIINFQAAEKKQRLDISIDENIPNSLIGDNQRLAQVITNLLGNAVKFTPDGGSISLDASLAGQENGMCELKITITDNGIGINPEQQNRLFQPFHQAESDITRKFGGTGLGLSISKNLVNMMGGEITVESTFGKGSSFMFTVQLAIDADENKTYDIGAEWKATRILVAGEDQSALMLFEKITQRFGAYCDTASSCEDALALIEKNGDYHIYFVDWNASKLGGMNLIEELKAKDKTNNIVLMISSADLSVLGEDPAKIGVDRFISKPIFPSAVVEIVNDILVTGQRGEFEQYVEPISFAENCILLVDDVEINREIVLSLLEQTQMTIDCAENGAEALQMFNEAPDRYSMIFMDIQMPVMDGYEATRRIRKSDNSKANTIPIIAMTANAFREDVEKCLEAGMNGHISKPVDYDVIIKELMVYLNVRL